MRHRCRTAQRAALVSAEYALQVAACSTVLVARRASAAPGGMAVALCAGPCHGPHAGCAGAGAWRSSSCSNCQHELRPVVVVQACAGGAELVQAAHGAGACQVWRSFERVAHTPVTLRTRICRVAQALVQHMEQETVGYEARMHECTDVIRFLQSILQRAGLSGVPYIHAAVAKAPVHSSYIVHPV